MQLGRQPAVYRPTTPKLAKYMAKGLPDVKSVDYTTGLTIPWQMLRNDDIGCCTLAGVGHMVMGFSITMNDPQLNMMTPTEVETYYKIIGHWDPSDPTTDNGCIMTDVLDYWKYNGIMIGSKPNQIFGYAYLKPTDIHTMRFALRYFGGLYIGIHLPQKCEDSDVWDAWDDDGGILGGHCVTLQGVDDDNNFFGISWGQRYTITPAFLAKYCDEMYCVNNEHFKDVDGLNSDALNADLTLIRSL